MNVFVYMQMNIHYTHGTSMIYECGIELFLSTDPVMNTKVIYDVRTKLDKYCKGKD